jgi:cytochrome c-type biogenesis protein
MFVLGFSLVFVTLGVAASLAGGVVLDAVPWIARVGGAILIVLGIATLGIVRVRWFEQERRAMGTAVTKVGSSPGGALVIGATFAAGWTPCIGPILAGILTLAAATGDVGRGASLLVAYSAGLAVPFLATTFAVARVPTAHRTMVRVAPVAQRIAGVLLILIGILLVTGQLTRLSTAATEVIPWTLG